MTSHVLIVDPDPYAAHVTRAIVARTAPEADFEVAATPEVALRVMERATPDVLIIDPAPQSPSARDLIAGLKLQHPEVRVVVLASAPTPNLRRAMEKLGVDVYLEKPVPFPRFVEELRAMIATMN